MQRESTHRAFESPRRDFLKSAAASAAGFYLASQGLPAIAQGAAPLRIATFTCDATLPPGEPMISCDPAKVVESPLLAKGIVLDDGQKRYVLCVLDWCELCNGAYLSMRAKIAEAAGTDASQVALQTVHQHTAPLVDTDGRKILAEAGDADKLHISLKTLEDVETRLAAAVKEAVAKLEPFDQIGVGQAKVDRVAASRRPVDASGKIAVRWSAMKDEAVKALPEGLIDPYVKTITFAQGAKPLVRLHYYATHPQTRYGDGRVSSDVVGRAREAIQQQEGVPQLYFTGCGGDITMGKYNTGSDEDRNGLAERLEAGMKASIAATEFSPADRIEWRVSKVDFPRRDDPEFNLEDALALAKNPAASPSARNYRGAVRVAFHLRKGEPIELSSLQIGKVFIVNLPGEPMIEFQLFAQKTRPDAFVAVAGYGDCSTGYICPAQAYVDGGYEPTDANTAPEAEALVKKAIRELLDVAAPAK